MWHNSKDRFSEFPTFQLQFNLYQQAYLTKTYQKFDPNKNES